VARGFGDFSLWSVGLVAFRPVVRQHIMAQSVWQRKIAYLVAGKKKGEEARVSQSP
jgi:hypothetical protein